MVCKVNIHIHCLGENLYENLGEDVNIHIGGGTSHRTTQTYVNAHRMEQR